MKNKYGFTLIELLSVVIILSVLTAIAVPQYTKSIHRAEAAQALVNLKTIYDSSKRYKSSFGEWPTSFKGLDTKLLLNTSATGQEFSPSDAWYGTSGVFKFSFPTDAVSACRVKKGDNGNPVSLYCLKATFSFGSETQDAFSCTYTSSKYKDLCASLCGTEPSSSTCIIK